MTSTKHRRLYWPGRARLGYFTRGLSLAVMVGMAWAQEGKPPDGDKGAWQKKLEEMTKQTEQSRKGGPGFLPALPGVPGPAGPAPTPTPPSPLGPAPIPSINPPPVPTGPMTPPLAVGTGSGGSAPAPARTSTSALALFEDDFDKTGELSYSQRRLVLLVFAPQVETDGWRTSSELQAWASRVVICPVHEGSLGARAERLAKAFGIDPAKGGLVAALVRAPANVAQVTGEQLLYQVLGRYPRPQEMAEVMRALQEGVTAYDTTKNEYAWSATLTGTTAAVAGSGTGTASVPPPAPAPATAPPPVPVPPAPAPAPAPGPFTLPVPPTPAPPAPTPVPPIASAPPAPEPVMPSSPGGSAPPSVLPPSSLPSPPSIPSPPSDVPPSLPPSVTIKPKETKPPEPVLSPFESGVMRAWKSDRPVMFIFPGKEPFDKERCAELWKSIPGALAPELLVLTPGSPDGSIGGRPVDWEAFFDVGGQYPHTVLAMPEFAGEGVLPKVADMSYRVIARRHGALSPDSAEILARMWMCEDLDAVIMRAWVLRRPVVVVFPHPEHERDLLESPVLAQIEERAAVYVNVKDAVSGIRRKTAAQVDKEFTAGDADKRAEVVLFKLESKVKDPAMARLDQIQLTQVNRTLAKKSADKIFEWVSTRVPARPPRTGANP